ncbi:ROK family protein [Myceligenerans xiligouense]|uniref:Putative NBD/HSP70 family sugar kinase n=1 Tax=Myceligenerans xiligouense TaxID=253184 RepID=A0A3N4YMX6_9MICO|nr:ROK family protein [Myceligenerans xiligouense]RPF22409.1 putative NBD/HSP70 family sugar kinase [Myceligenerans xiligouense]
MTNTSTNRSGSAAHTVGLDIGGTKILGALLDADGALVATTRLTTELGPDGVVRSAARAVRDVVDAAGLRLAAVDGVGLGIPGIVDARAGTVKHAVNLGVSDELPLAERLSGALGGIPVVVENDLNVAAVGAAHVLEREGAPVPDDGPGAAPAPGVPAPAHHEDLAFLALGTGVASGLVMDGRLRRGVTGAAGEIGHVPVDPAGPECSCGQRGCIETFVSGTALATAWPSRHGKPSPAELFEAAEAGDAAAIVVRKRFADAVASAVRLLVLTVDVRYVVLGGGVAQLGRPLLDVVRDSLREQAEVSPFLASLGLPARVTLAPSDVPVAAVGAAVLGRRDEQAGEGSPERQVPRGVPAAPTTSEERAGTDTALAGAETEGTLTWRS